jgi:hypothetical protein
MNTENLPMRRFELPEGYRCPLCPGHQDEADDFEWCELLSAPICRGCGYEIHYGFVGWEDRPTPGQYNHVATIDRLEKLTGSTYRDLKTRYMESLVRASSPDFREGS